MSGKLWVPPHLKKRKVEGHTIATAEGRRIEYGLATDEENFLRWKEEHRRPLWEAALYAAISNRREIERRMALGLGVPLEVWPEATPLNGKERTLLMAELANMWGLPEQRGCLCPGRFRGEHRSACTRETPWQGDD